MATPNKNTVARKRPDIQGSVEEFDLQANNEKMIATRLFPQFDVGTAGGDYGRIPIEQLLQKAKTSRASGASYGRGEFEFEEAFFQTKENGWEVPVDERDKKMYADYFDAEVVSSEICRSTILMNREIRVRDATFGNSAINGVDVTADAADATPQGDVVTAEWSDWAAAKPIHNVEAARRRHRARTGLWPNGLVLNYLTFIDLQNCEQVLDRISASGAGHAIKASDVTEAMLSQVFNLEMIVGGAAENTAGKGLAVDVGEVWTTGKAMICHLLRKGEKNIRKPGLGRSFHWGGDGSQIDGLQESYWEEKCRSDIQRCRQETDERCTYPEMAEILTGLAG